MSKTHNSKNLSGQAVIETLLVLPPLAFFSFMFSFYIYRTTIESVMHDLVDQALICTTSYSLLHCENKLKAKLNHLSKHILIHRLELETLQEIELKRQKIDLKYTFIFKELYQIKREIKWDY